MIDLARAHRPLAAELVAAFERVVRDGCFILGEEVAAFEREVARAIGVEHAVGMSSGTDALLAALLELDLEAGDEVLCPAFTFFSTAGSVWRAGLRPAFADVSARSFNSGREELEARLGPRTRAIVVVHLFGRLAEMEPILELARSRDLAVIEDAAQALGAADAGRQAGTFARTGCFSFFPTKNLGGFGDGGLVTTASAERAERLRVLRNLGQGAARYVHDQVSGNFRLDALQAALLRVKLPHLAAMNERRRDVAARYDRLFADSGLAARREPVPGAPEGAGARSGGDAAELDTAPLVLPEPAGEAHVFHQYVVRILPPHRRDALRQHLTGAGIETQVYYPVPLHLQPCFRELGYRAGTLPVAERLAGEVLALPMHPDLAADEQSRVVEQVAAFFARGDRSAGARRGAATLRAGSDRRA
ncbi:MAG TPA: DegT/DnrJ/EryC1/StrS family aminotransferase [Thermoanaerobaculia bacterium]|nr:DegT/DnrJ/EryC1/StrS family aminotransferase [Thermoanaerobaculia bacterium]